MAPGNKAMEAIVRAYNAQKPPESFYSPTGYPGMPGNDAIDIMLEDILAEEVPPVIIPVAQEGQHPYRGGYPSVVEPKGWLRVTWERLRVFFR